MKSKTKDILLNFDGYIACGLFIALATLLFYEVLSRYIFASSSAHIQELCGIGFIWAVYLSISYATGKKIHIVVDVAGMLFPQPWLKYINLIANLIFLGFTLLMTWYGSALVMSTFEYSFRTAVLDISMGIPYSIIPFSFGLMSLRLVGAVCQNLRIIQQERAENTRGGSHA